jgi:hypothetical protein
LDGAAGPLTGLPEGSKTRAERGDSTHVSSAESRFLAPLPEYFSSGTIMWAKDVAFRHINVEKAVDGI